jgi:putative nucleotidyltransferase with HDIG domain
MALGLAAPELERLRLGGLLHDIGKIGMPDAVLFKAGRLTADEITVMRTHPDVGMRILDGLHLPFDVLPIVRSHHERWDGAGYPDRTVGAETHHLARLVHVVDVYEALTARRIYREPMPTADIVEFFQHGRGTDFDPDLVEPFLQLLADGTFDRIREETKRTVIQRPLSSVPGEAP